MAADLTLPTVRRRGLLLVGAAAMLWGTSGLTATVAYDRGVHPFTVSSWRMALGAVALLPLLLRGGSGGREAGQRLCGRELRRLATVGIALGAYQACYFLAVQLAGVAIATLLTLGLAPVLVVLGERMITRRPTEPATLVGIVLALAGLAALVGMPSGETEGLLAGAALAIGSAVGYAVLTLAGGALSRRMDARRLTVLAFVIAAGVLLPITAATAGLGLGRDPVAWVAMLYLGILPTAVAYRLFFAGLERVTASSAAVLVLLEPLVATTLAVSLIGERLDFVGWLGAALLVGAVVVVSVVASSRGTGDGAPDPGRRRHRPGP